MIKSKLIPYVRNVELKPIKHGYTGELGAAIDALNNRYSFVTMDGRHKAFDHKEKMFIEIESLMRKHNKSITYQNKQVKLTPLWLGEEDLRREFDRVVFKPYANVGQNNPEHFNLWYGWAIQPSESASDAEFKEYVEPWLNHIKTVFCSKNEEQYQYFIHWLAQMFQAPEIKPGIAIIIKSGQGFGKGLLMTMLQSIIGDDYTIRVSDSSQVAGGFSGHLNNKILINLDEATWGGDKKSQGRLKALITERRIALEAKHADVKEIDHYARFLITTNSNYPIPIEIDDRRMFVPDVSTVKPSREEFKKLISINNNPEALKHIFHYFLTLNLEDFIIDEFPHSNMRKDLQKESLNYNDVYMAFVLACFHDDEKAIALCQEGISGGQLYERFMDWKNNGTFRNTPTSICAFGKFLSAAGFNKKRVTEGFRYTVSKNDVQKFLEIKKMI